MRQEGPPLLNEDEIKEESVTAPGAGVEQPLTKDELLQKSIQSAASSEDMVRVGQDEQFTAQVHNANSLAALRTVISEWYKNGNPIVSSDGEYEYSKEDLLKLLDDEQLNEIFLPGLLREKVRELRKAQKESEMNPEMVKASVEDYAVEYSENNEFTTRAQFIELLQKGIVSLQSRQKTESKDFTLQIEHLTTMIEEAEKIQDAIKDDEEIVASKKWQQYFLQLSS